MTYSPHQLSYFAHRLTLRGAADSMDRMASALLDAQVDLNPHQVDAAMFATGNPLAKGAILADEVGLGKTIEAGLLLAQRWAERHRRLLVIAPANLRKQWHQELADKFGLPAVILEARPYRLSAKEGRANPFDLGSAGTGSHRTADAIVICSYQFAAGKAGEVAAVPWDLVVIDEAHRLRNVYKPENKTANILRDALVHAHKVLLTATPLQNTLLELYVRALNSVVVFDTPKPERLLKRVLEVATRRGDLVLDSFAGSGTTGAVAQKMGRRWIMVELGEHCHTHIIPRMRAVIDGQDHGGVTGSVGWEGGGGFRYYRLAPSLLQQDRFGQWVINREYNAEMLAAAVAKLEGFTFSPSADAYWQHGYSTETDFIYVTTQTLNVEALRALSEEVGSKRTLLVCCSAFRLSAEAIASRFPNLTVKKIPKMVLQKCEWGHDDYSLNVENLPAAAPATRRQGGAARPQGLLFGEEGA